MQREPGALRDRGCAGRAAAVRRDVRARALSLRGGRRRDRRAPSGRRRRRAARVIDMPMDVLLGQAPEDAPRRAARRARAAAARPRRRRAPQRGVRRAAPSDRREQAIPRHDRRPHRRRPVAPRPDGRPVAGSGRRLRGHARRLPRLCRRGDGAWASARRSPSSTRPHRAGWRWARRSPTCSPRRSRSSASSSAATGWPRAATTPPPGDDAALYDTVRAVGMELCPALGIGIPVGKDSLSMRTRWQGDGGEPKQVTAPVSLVVTAFASLDDVRTHADAAAPARRHDAPAGRPRLRPDAAWAARSSRRRPASSAPRCPTWTTREMLRAARRRDERVCATPASSSRTTTAATAASGQRRARWRSPATWA